ncbi:E3 ubiquitin-protein ligase sina [Folsomia candida]|uniref:E3 ubiquitin-protein ligase sina n=1 Tax=Folsomia candida TaxID=158441 RepID=A0A226EWM7_FOLCA|nr:E3 ubiquitin-protein ligase sina [Folsomia candida]OXA61590.1 E3 ubiquitin-protein ligase sina [Folsomia candida]
MAQPRALRDLGDLMDCTICLDEPASPIHNCANGHIICGICVDKVRKCGMCQTDLNVSPFAERLSRQFEFKLPCRNQNSGCNEVIAASEMKNHFQNHCYFRDILCTEWKTERCKDVKVPLKEYSKHLQERHKCLTPPSQCFTLKVPTATDLFGEAGLSIPTGILDQDGHTFLLLSQITPTFVYFWMTVLGSKETAEKFMFELKVFATLESGKKVETLWTIPVVAFHDRPKYLQDSTFYAIVPVRTVKEFGTLIEKGKIRQIRFNTSYRIF